MYFDLSSLFHRSSKDLSDKRRVHIPQDPSVWPDEWKTIYHKSYGRLPKMALARRELHADLHELIKKRRSGRDFTRRGASLEPLAQLLEYSCGLNGQGGGQSRAQPSGGARFPLEVYPVVFRGSADLPSGLYHYNVREHALDVLWTREFTPDDISGLFVYPWIRDASFALVITAVFWRNQIKYGERGYRYILLEAGHLGENVYLAASALGMKCCAMGGMRDENIERLLDIDGITESVVHSLILD